MTKHRWRANPLNRLNKATKSYGELAAYWMRYRLWSVLRKCSPFAVMRLVPAPLYSKTHKNDDRLHHLMTIFHTLLSYATWSCPNYCISGAWHISQKWWSSCREWWSMSRSNEWIPQVHKNTNLSLPTLNVAAACLGRMRKRPQPLLLGGIMWKLHIPWMLDVEASIGCPYMKTMTQYPLHSSLSQLYSNLLDIDVWPTH